MIGQNGLMKRSEKNMPKPSVNSRPGRIIANWASNKEKIKEQNGRAATCAAASAMDGPAASIEPRRRGRRWRIIKNKRGWKAEAEKKNKTRGGEKTDLI